ncbi:MAG: hypothetical protein GX856_03775 [Gammaproteobacteria bacterium]|jgi:hypothetical protein|nr:hypothetical protein [Gammaproteobacteria bacterium]
MGLGFILGFASCAVVSVAFPRVGAALHAGVLRAWAWLRRNLRRGPVA